MSTLLNKEDGNITKELLSKHSPLLNRAPASRDKNPREKGALRPQPNRDCVKIVNEKNSATATNAAAENDEDSEAEKLSPLLNTKIESLPKEVTTLSPLHIEGIEDSIDDTDTDLDENENNDERDKVIIKMFCL